MSDRNAPVAGVLLAAGTSTRLGPGTNKLLIDLGGETVVRRAVRTAVEAGLAPVIVVVGFEAARVVPELNGFDVEIVTNDRFTDGINTSVQLGIECVPAGCAAAVVLLADMPFVTSSMVTSVVDRYRTGTAPLVLSLYGEVSAPPTVYDRSLFGEFDGPAGEGCGRRVVRRHRAEAASIVWPEDRLADLDAPDDVSHVKARLAEAST